MSAHHAYYIEGPPSLFDAYKNEVKPFWARAFERFGIEDARELSALASLKNFADSTFFLAVSSMTTEAQQALLKLFEEPQRGTTFLVLLPHGILLPTLRSRMLPYPIKGDALDQSSSRRRLGAEQFLSAHKKERSDFVAKLLKDEEGARERARELVNALEVELSKNMEDARAREGLQDLAKVRDYLRDRSPSLKMLLEHLALTLPRP